MKLLHVVETTRKVTSNYYANVTIQKLVVKIKDYFHSFILLRHPITVPFSDFLKGIKSFTRPNLQKILFITYLAFEIIFLLNNSFITSMNDSKLKAIKISSCDHTS